MSASLANLAYRATEIGNNGAGIHMLVADNDPQEHLLIAMAADHCEVPLQFSFVTNGVELLLRLGMAPTVADFPDVLLLDLEIDGLDGKQTLEELQAHPLMSQIPVVVCSSSPKLLDEVDCYPRGAVWFEAKPTTLTATTDFVKRVSGFANTGSYKEPNPMVLSLLHADLVADVEDRMLVDLPDDVTLSLP